MTDKNLSLKYLSEKLNDCSLCELRADCISPVGWFGNPDSPLVIVGEGPGRTEDEYGCPLIGQSGQLLDKALFAAQMTRDRIMTTNVVKCRPKNNKTPSIKEGAFCASNWLDKELEIIKPAVVVALGSVALHYLGDSDKKITKERGLWFKTRTGIDCITTYHPAYLLRLSGDSLKKAKWDVFNDLTSALNRAKEANPDYQFKSDEPTDLFKLFSKR